MRVVNADCTWLDTAAYAQIHLMISCLWLKGIPTVTDRCISIVFGYLIATTWHFVLWCLSSVYIMFVYSNRLSMEDFKSLPPIHIEVELSQKKCAQHALGHTSNQSHPLTGVASEGVCVCVFSNDQYGGSIWDESPTGLRNNTQQHNCRWGSHKLFPNESSGNLLPFSWINLQVLAMNFSFPSCAP